MSSQETIADRYKILDRLGKGGMGVVYKALDTVLQRHVAVKVLTVKDYTDEQFRRFQQEAKATSRLNHPGIVTVLDFGVTDRQEPFLVMEYLEGRTLAVLLERQGHLNIEDFESIFSQLGRALIHAHSAGVIHRDLKPSNIMICSGKEGPKAFILDFGIAKILDDKSSVSNTKTGVLVGSPRYISPEQVLGEPADGRSDIYSLGCVMFEALTGRPPFMGATTIETLQMHLNQDPPSLSESTEEIFPEELELLIERALAKKPEERFQSMVEFLEQLKKPSRQREPVEYERAGNTMQTLPLPKSTGRFLGLAGILAIVFSISLVISIRSDRVQLSNLRHETIPATLTKPGDLFKEIEGGAYFDRANAVPPDSFLQSKNLLHFYNGLSGVKDSNLLEFRRKDPKALALNLSQSKIVGEGLRHIQGMRLSHLNLSTRPIKDSDLAFIADLPDLESLVLDECLYIKGAGLRHLRRLSKLKLLSMRNCMLSRAGLVNIGKLETLEVLKLSGSRVESIEHLQELTRCRSLRKLNVRDMKISPEVISAIKRGLPKCKINY